jgi:hypothetical protein
VKEVVVAIAVVEVDVHEENARSMLSIFSPGGVGSASLRGGCVGMISLRWSSNALFKFGRWMIQWSGL